MKDDDKFKEITYAFIFNREEEKHQVVMILGSLKQYNCTGTKYKTDGYK